MRAAAYANGGRRAAAVQRRSVLAQAAQGHLDLGAGVEKNEHGIHFDWQGNAWISGNESLEGQILNFTREGKLILQLGKVPPYQPGVEPSKQFGNPHCVRRTRDGLLYVCDRPNNRIQVFLGDGTMAGEFRGLHNMTLDSRGNLYTTEAEN